MATPYFPNKRTTDVDVMDEKLHDPDHVEKVLRTVAIDNIQVLGLRPDDAEFYMNYPPEARKKLLRKVFSSSSASPRTGQID
jgi:hypothetical protein